MRKRGFTLNGDTDGRESILMSRIGEGFVLAVILVLAGTSLAWGGVGTGYIELNPSREDNVYVVNESAKATAVCDDTYCDFYEFLHWVVEGADVANQMANPTRITFSRTGEGMIGAVFKPNDKGEEAAEEEFAPSVGFTVFKVELTCFEFICKGSEVELTVSTNPAEVYSDVASKISFGLENQKAYQGGGTNVAKLTDFTITSTDNKIKIKGLNAGTAELVVKVSGAKCLRIPFTVVEINSLVLKENEYFNTIEVKKMGMATLQIFPPIRVCGISIVVTTSNINVAGFGPSGEKSEIAITNTDCEGKAHFIVRKKAGAVPFPDPCTKQVIAHIMAKCRDVTQATISITCHNGRPILWDETMGDGWPDFPRPACGEPVELIGWWSDLEDSTLKKGNAVGNVIYKGNPCKKLTFERPNKYKIIKKKFKGNYFWVWLRRECHFPFTCCDPDFWIRVIITDCAGKVGFKEARTTGKYDEYPYCGRY